MKPFRFSKITILILGVFSLLLVLFFLNFSFSKTLKVQVKVTPETVEALKMKLADLSKGTSKGIGIAGAPCYQVRPGCEFWANREKGGFPSDYQFSEEEEYCMFNWCLSWEPPTLTVEFTGQELTLLFNELSGPDTPFEDVNILFEENLIKASATIKKPRKGNLYVEGYLARQDEFSIKFDLQRAQFNNLEAKRAAHSFVETEINKYFNSQLSYLAGFRIDKLEVKDNKLRFEGIFSGFPSEKEDLRILYQ